MLLNYDADVMSWYSYFHHFVFRLAATAANGDIAIQSVNVISMAMG
jgi:hypothetical protein